MKRATSSTGKKGRSILIADADEEAAVRLAEYFSTKGFRTFIVSDGKEALNLADDYAPSVAIIDVALRDMPGHVLAHQLKRSQPTIRLLMTTGDYRPELEVRARQVGILLYAHKPADCRLLEAAVTKAMEEPV